MKWKLLWYFHVPETSASPKININKHRFSSACTLKTNGAAQVTLKTTVAIFSSLLRDVHTSSHYLARTLLPILSRPSLLLSVWTLMTPVCLTCVSLPPGVFKPAQLSFWCWTAISEGVQSVARPPRWTMMVSTWFPACCFTFVGLFG